MKALAVDYRPQTFEDVCGQSSIVKILERQLELNKIKNCYLFCGQSGTGKTTIARIFAYRINKGKGSPIEIDAASNNSVDNVRTIIEEANTRALDAEYKIFIVDECVTGDTEILTDEGYKRIDSLTKKEKIAQYLDNGDIEFVEPLDYVEKYYEGDMFKMFLRNGNRAVLMSPHHVQPLLKVKSNEIVENYISDVKFNQNYRIITSGKGTGLKSTLTALDKLAIASQADGYFYGIRKRSNFGYWIIGLSNTDKIQNFLNYAKEANVEVKEIKSRPETNVRRFSYKLPIDITKKLTTHFNLDFSYDGAKCFIDEIMKWDGSKKSGYDGFYSCVDVDNVNFVSAVATLAGYSADQVSYDNHNKNHSVINMLRLTQTDNRTAEACSKVKEENFKGKIYCVKVPSHKIIIRAQGFTFVTGNCHALSNAAWQAFLKTIEEPPEKTIFMFCTTNPEKIPGTIQNRVMKFNLSKVPTKEIKNRLLFICKNEGFKDYEESCDYIAKISDGGVRDAIASLDKVADYSDSITIENTLNILGNYSYKDFLTLTNALIDSMCDINNEKTVLNILETIDNSGKNMKNFVDQYINFILDLLKYALFKDMNSTKLPLSLEDNVKYAISFDGNINIFNKMIDSLLTLKNNIRYDNNPAISIKATFLKIARGE